MSPSTPMIGTRLTFGQRELRRPSLRDDVEQLEELVLFDSSRVDPKGRTYIDPDFTGINIIPNGPMLYIISQLKSRDLCNVAQVSHRFNTLTDQYREHYYSEEDFETLKIRRDIVGILWLAKHHPKRKCSYQVLDWASANGHAEIVKLLLVANKPCTEYALNWASKHGYTEVVKLLLEAGSPYSDCTALALDWASMNGYVEIVRLLLAKNKPCTKWALMNAPENGHTEVVKLLLAANKPCTSWALDRASSNDHIEVAKLLLKAGSPYSDCTHWALDRASENGHIEIVKLLLAADKPCTLKAFVRTSRNGHTKIINLLSAQFGFKNSNKIT